jgi:glutamate synthase (NADPH) small chain
MPKKEINLNRQSMPKQGPRERVKNFKEVALGYNRDMAVAEAGRCLGCPKAPCIGDCPVGVHIPEFIKAIAEDNIAGAVKILKKDNSLPGICGRVCPQETQCERGCTLEKKNAPIAIGRLERFAADWELANPGKVKYDIESVKPTGKKVAVVGSGPAGLTVSGDLARLGHKVTLFEALHAAGGVLIYGIPEFRLPKNIVATEVKYVQSLGVELRLDSVIGKVLTVDELLETYDAVFLGTGAGAPNFMEIPGENMNGIYSANEFLTRVNLMKAYLFPEFDTPIKKGRRVAVIGGGNVAMDSARCALRLGAEKVYIIYRRSRTEMPARAEEAENAGEEGIEFRLLTNPVRYIGDANNNVIGIECVEIELGEPDFSGRRRPIPKKGSEFMINVDTVVVAIGTTPNPLVPSTTKELYISSHGTVIVETSSGKTSKPGVWAGGDVATGAATVISAMGAGKAAAASIDNYLKNKTLWPPVK